MVPKTQIGEGRDARNLPSAQPVEEVCDVILDVIKVCWWILSTMEVLG